MLKQIHDELTDCYYNKKPYQGEILTKERFEELHLANRKAQEIEDITLGKILPKIVNEKENLIQDKIRAQAISALQAEGKLDAAGNVVKGV